LSKLIAVFWPFLYPKRYGQKAKELKKTAQKIKLLKIGEMRVLYPDGNLWHEEFFGFKKSIIVYRLSLLAVYGH